MIIGLAIVFSLILTRKIWIGLDLEATLVNVEGAHHSAHLRVLRDFGIIMTVEEAIEKFPRFIGGPDKALYEEDIIPYIKQVTGIDCNLEDLLQRKKKYYSEALKEMKIELRPRAREAIQWFQAQGYRIVIESVTEPSQALLLLKKTGLIDLIGMKNIILGVEGPKWRTVYKKFGIKKLVVFEDSPTGMKSAISGGCLAAIGMPVYYTKLVIGRLKEAGAFKVFSDWREINLSALMEEIESLE